MTETTLSFDGELVLSRHLDYFRRGDEYYVYHNLYGYILKMSEDVLEFLEFFREKPRVALETDERFIEAFQPESIMEFANVFSLQRCLVEPETPEEDALGRYYPVHAPWIVYHQPAKGPVTVCAMDQDSKDRVFMVQLDEWDSELWRKVGGETPTAELVEEMRGVKGSPVGGLEARVVATLGKLTHHHMQVLKMSSKPTSFFEGKRKYAVPPYLRSSMPYERITEAFRNERSGPQVLLSGLQSAPIDPELLELDATQNTFAELFRDPHEGLGGRSYGGALIDYLVGCPEDNGRGRILEVGARTGSLALGVMNALKARNPARYEATQYVALAPDEASATRIQAALEGAGHDGVSVVVGDPMALGDALSDQPPFDLVLCNEFAANLEAQPVRRISREVVEDDEETGESSTPEKANGKGRHDAYIAEGDAVNLIFRLGLSEALDDAPDDFYLNTGAIRLIESMHAVAASDAQVVIVEFGDLFNYPIQAANGERLVHSLHFKVLGHVAKHLGYQSDFGYLKDKLGFVDDVELLASTRSHFAALRHLLSTFGATLERRAYTRAQFEALLTEHDIDPATVHDVKYETLDERALGLVTHSFKLMRLFNDPESVDAGVEL